MKMSTHGGDWAGFRREYGVLPLDFSANISPLGFLPEVREAAAAAISASDRYPDPHCSELRSALSAHFNIPAEQIVCGNGAADLIYRLVFLLKPKSALVPVPSFTEYEKALTQAGCLTEHIFCRKEHGFILPESVTDAITPETDLVFLCNPNNPTGRLIPQPLLHAVLKKCGETNSVLVVDECFLPFADEGEANSLVGTLEKCPQVVVLRAFTKLYAMPGLRLGMALCGSRELAERLGAFGQPWPVSAPAQAAGLAALQQRSLAEQTRILVREERAFLQVGLSELGLTVIPGEANFLLFYAAKEELSIRLRKEGILIRDCSDFTGLTPGWFRVAVRTREENRLLLTKLREVLHVG